MITAKNRTAHYAPLHASDMLLARPSFDVYFIKKLSAMHMYLMYGITKLDD